MRSRSNLNVQVLFLRREKIGAPAEKLLKAMTTNTNKLKKHMVLQESLWLLGVDVGTCNEHIATMAGGESFQHCANFALLQHTSLGYKLYFR